MQTALDTLCPMHVVLDDTGHIVHGGPTLSKVLDEPCIGKRFLEVFELKRPRAVQSMTDLREMSGITLHLRMRDATKTSLKGVMIPVASTGQFIINLSFGISVVEAVRNYALTSSDFAATDLAIEMLYLVEAKSAALEASRTLNQRLQGAMIAAEEQAFTDTLTGLKNRRALDHVLARLSEYRSPFSLMQLDLDFFKKVNDTMGHAAGDHVLLQVARIVVEETRSEDTVARAGGDEFVLIFHNTWKAEQLAEIAARLIKRLEEPIPFGSQTCRISGSIGITCTSQYDTLNLGRIFEDVDIALYASKHAGRGRYTFYTDDLRDGDVLQGIQAVS